MCSLASPFTSEKVLEPNIQLPYKKKKKNLSVLGVHVDSDVNYSRKKKQLVKVKF